MRLGNVDTIILNAAGIAILGAGAVGIAASALGIPYSQGAEVASALAGATLGALLTAVRSHERRSDNTIE